MQQSNSVKTQRAVRGDSTCFEWNMGRTESLTVIPVWYMSLQGRFSPNRPEEGCAPTNAAVLCAGPGSVCPGIWSSVLQQQWAQNGPVPKLGVARQTLAEDRGRKKGKSQGISPAHFLSLGTSDQQWDTSGSSAITFAFCVFQSGPGVVV